VVTLSWRGDTIWLAPVPLRRSPAVRIAAPPWFANVPRAAVPCFTHHGGDCANVPCFTHVVSCMLSLEQTAWHGLPCVHMRLFDVPAWLDTWCIWFEGSHIAVTTTGHRARWAPGTIRLTEQEPCRHLVATFQTPLIHVHARIS
jgi:hypothetical protein